VVAASLKLCFAFPDCPKASEAALHTNTIASVLFMAFTPNSIRFAVDSPQRMMTE
jgi:hypothetical protein